LIRVCAAADFGNGASQILPSSHTYINPDLTIYLHRYPRGEWVCIDAVTRVEDNGIGLAESRLLDRDGTIGRAVQSLIIEERK
jgi:acyl-CoA thioesterase